MGDAASVFDILGGRTADASVSPRRAGAPSSESRLSEAGSAFAALLEAMSARSASVVTGAQQNSAVPESRTASAPSRDLVQETPTDAAAPAFPPPSVTPYMASAETVDATSAPPAQAPQQAAPAEGPAAATSTPPQSASPAGQAAQAHQQAAPAEGPAAATSTPPQSASPAGQAAQAHQQAAPAEGPAAATSTPPRSASPAGQAAQAHQQAAPAPLNGTTPEIALAVTASAAVSRIRQTPQTATVPPDASRADAAAPGAEEPVPEQPIRPEHPGKATAAPQTLASKASIGAPDDDQSELARLLHRQEPDRQSAAPRASRRPAPGDQTAQTAPPRPDQAASAQQPNRITSMPQPMPDAPDAGADTWPDLLPSSASLLQAYGGDLSASSAALDGARIDGPLRHLVPDAARPDIQTVALRIAQKAEDGSRRFEIELDPPELGRVEVRLEFGRDGRVKTHMLVDRADTLDALLRDSRGLERALSASGLKLEGGIQYELRDQSSFAQSQGGRDQADGEAARSDRGSDDTTELPAPSPHRHRHAGAGGLDLRI